MITIGMNYRVAAGKEEAFVRMFDKVLEAMSAMPEHTSSRLYRDVHEPPSFLIVSQWRTRRAFEAFVASELFRKVAAWGRDVLTARPVHQVYGEDEPEASPGAAGG
ncbi:MAG: antibiotic biosynthesis monooxygenase [Phycisphaerae bacterium]|jgi:heme-degrading monooxygenase HmoA